MTQLWDLKDHFIDLVNIEQASIELFHLSGKRNDGIVFLQVPTSYL